MKRIFVFLPLLILISCSKKKIPKLFSHEVLTRQEYSIDPSKDTTIGTLHGSFLRIMAGTFSGKVKLEIKEAFTPTEMLAAGLTTESNGRPLRSAGMIYINATMKGKPVEMLKPIKVSVPNSYYDSAMQLFKGEVTDSSVNWIDPTPVDSTPQSKNWQAGKILFQSKCKSCHEIFKDKIGPALAGVEKRIPDRNIIYSWIRNPSVTMFKYPYFERLKAKYATMMLAYPLIDDKSIDALLDYVKNEEQNPANLFNPVKKDSNSIYDTSFAINTESALESIDLSAWRNCGYDTLYVPTPKSDQAQFEGQAASPSTTNATQIVNNDTSPIKPGPSKAESMEGLRNGFTDPNPTNGMYDFEIKTSGWYNIDAYVEGYAGATNVKLWVRLQVEFDIDMHVYLFCPDKKMLSIMNDRKGDLFFFNKINEAIPLFLGDKAVLFAFGSKNDKMYYGIKELKIRGEQTIEIKINETSEKDIRNALYQQQLEGIDLGIEKKTEKVIRMKPCNGSWLTDTSNAIK